MDIYFTGATTFLGEQNNNRSSLGGYISGSIIPISIDGVLPSLSQKDLLNGSKLYIGLAIRNNTDVAIPSAKVYYNNLSQEPVTTLRMALVSTGKDDCDHEFIEDIPNTNTKPLSATFFQNKGEFDALILPNLEPNQYIGIWIERSVIKSKGVKSLSCETLLNRYDAEDIKHQTTFEWITANQDSSWNFNTTENKYYVWYDDGVVIDPQIAGREGIRVSYDADIDIMLQNTLQRLQDFLEDREEVEFELNNRTLTATMLINGPVESTPSTPNIQVVDPIQGSTRSASLVENIELIVEY